MSGVFDRLNKKLELEKKEGGISPLDLAELPPKLRNIMRMMLREVDMYHADLVEAVEDMPNDMRLDARELDQALQVLVEQGWLIRRGEGDKLNYQVNLRRKPGSKLAQGIWSILDTKIKQEPDTQDTKPDEPPTG
jgi:hypothetical protein